MSEIVGNVTMWAKKNIGFCAQHELIYDINSTESVMLHRIEEDDLMSHTVDLLLGPRDVVSHECQMLKQMASLGRLPMVTWGCTPEELGFVSPGLPTTAITMLPEYVRLSPLPLSPPLSPAFVPLTKEVVHQKSGEKHKRMSGKYGEKYAERLTPFIAHLFTSCACVCAC